MEMLGFFVCLVLSRMSVSYAMKIDLSSLHMNPDLYRLCWRQFDDKKIDYLTVDNKQDIPVLQEKDENNNIRYCVENIGETSSHTVAFPLTENKDDGYFILAITFSLPLSPPFQIIRKKIVPKGIHFKLLNDYAGILSNITSECVVIFEYEVTRQKLYKVVQMNSISKSEYFLSLDPETSFSVYYSCVLHSFMQTSSAFIIEKGEIFPRYKIDLIKPFIQFPFRKFLVSQWHHYSTVPNYYILAVYEIKYKIKKCLKIFRFFKITSKNSLNFEKPFISHEGCGAETDTEDIGFYNDIENGRVYVVLDMFTLLKINMLYEFSMKWIIKENTEKMTNYIYFEVWPNENCALINIDILNYDPNKYEYYSNLTSDIRQNVSCEYRSMPFNESSFPVVVNKNISVLPALSSTKPVYEFQTSLNYSNAKRMMNAYCLNTFNPFCYFMILDTSDRKIELIEVQKPEDSTTKIRGVKFISELGDPMFTVSLDLYPKSLSQAMFIVEIYDERDKCSLICILTCKTCNQRFKQVSAERSEEAIEHSKQKCKENVQILENHYEATDTFISFQTKEMPYDQNFSAKAYSVNLFGTTESVKSDSHCLKESFFQRHGYLIIYSLVQIFVFIPALALFFYYRKMFCFKRRAQTPFERLPNETYS